MSEGKRTQSVREMVLAALPAASTRALASPAPSVSSLPSFRTSVPRFPATLPFRSLLNAFHFLNLLIVGNL